MLVSLIAVIAWILECLGQILKSNSTLELKKIKSFEQGIQKFIKQKFRRVPLIIKNEETQREVNLGELILFPTRDDMEEGHKRYISFNPFRNKLNAAICYFGSILFWMAGFFLLAKNLGIIPFLQSLFFGYSLLKIIICPFLILSFVLILMVFGYGSFIAWMQILERVFPPTPEEISKEIERVKSNQHWEEVYGNISPKKMVRLFKKWYPPPASKLEPPNLRTLLKGILALILFWSEGFYLGAGLGIIYIIGYIVRVLIFAAVLYPIKFINFIRMKFKTKSIVQTIGLALCWGSFILLGIIVFFNFLRHP